MAQEKSSVIGQFTGKCCDSNVFNNNDMKLPRQLFENLFASDEYKNAIKNKYYIGYLGHPEDPNCMDFRNACITMTECHIDDQGEVYGTFDLVDTPVGRVVKAFIDAGVTFGISIRGAGDVDGGGNVDPETFVFRGFDLVTFPAYDDCVPTFQSIAASSDIDKKVKYKKVCAAVKRNLTKITSCEALDLIKSQFKDSSPEYAEIGTRIEELNRATEESDALSLAEQKIDGLTNLLLEAKQESAELRQELQEANESLIKSQMAEYQTRVTCSRKISSFKRISASQIRDLTDQYDESADSYKKQVLANKKLRSQLTDMQSQLIKATDSYKVQVSANTRLKRQLKDLKDENLKYFQQIEATSKTISQKDSTISNLENELRETVTASKKVKKEASNLDDNVRSLQRRVEAAEQMVLDYQEAYANMYANALGVHISNLSVTASTSVEDLRSMICSKTISSPSHEEPEFSEFDSTVSDDETVTM